MWTVSLVCYDACEGRAVVLNMEYHESIPIRGRQLIVYGHQPIYISFI